MIHPETSSYESFILSRYQTVPRFWVLFFIHVLCEHMHICEFSCACAEVFWEEFCMQEANRRVNDLINWLNKYDPRLLSQSVYVKINLLIDCLIALNYQRESLQQIYNIRSSFQANHNCSSPRWLQSFLPPVLHCRASAKPKTASPTFRNTNIR